MNTELSITRDINRPADRRGAYHARVAYADTADALHDLRQIGPVENNVIYYRGVYATRIEAEAAARAYQFPKAEG